MSDRDFFIQVRRALITLARALEKRYNFTGLLIILDVPSTRADNLIDRSLHVNPDLED